MKKILAVLLAVTIISSGVMSVFAVPNDNDSEKLDISNEANVDNDELQEISEIPSASNEEDSFDSNSSSENFSENDETDTKILTDEANVLSEAEGISSEQSSENILGAFALTESTPVPDMRTKSAAKTTTKTRDEAIAWVRSQEGKSVDFDGVFGAQCVDLILAYYDYLGAIRVFGNGTDYVSNPLPEGWQRIKDGKAEPGDILIYTGTYGHVGIYEDDKITYHQNYSGAQFVQKLTYQYNDNGWFVPDIYWGVIRPNWKGGNSTAPTPNPSGTVTEVKTTVAGLRIRSGAGTNHGIVTTLASSNIVLIVISGSLSDEWIRIKTTDGRYTGFVSTQYVQIHKTAADTSTPNPTITTGWKAEGASTVYYNNSGNKATGWQTISGKTFYFDNSGKMLTGWQDIGGKTFFFKRTGVDGTKGYMHTGWHTIDGKKFFFKRTGVDGTRGHLHMGWHTIDGKRFFFKRTGANGTIGHLHMGWHTIDGKRFFFKRTGANGTIGHLHMGWHTIDGKRFFFKRTGANGTIGHLHMGWHTIDGKRFFFKRTGASGTIGHLHIGWHTIDGKRFFFRDTGASGTIGERLIG